MTEFGEKERDVLQLLRDYRPFIASFGGAMPLDETGVVDASYGPAGMVLTGAGFEKRDVPGLLRSYRALAVALAILRRERFQEWGALIEPYLSDVADSGVVEDWRGKVSGLDRENEEIRAENARRLKKGRPAKPPKVRHVWIRTQLERHDRAIERLAEMLRDVDLHVVNPRLMSAREQAAGDAANAQIYAYYQQVRVAGRTHLGAVSATAWKFGISDADVERIVEFRSDVKLATCAEEGCERGVFSQNLCEKHYRRQHRAKKREAS